LIRVKQYNRTYIVLIMTHTIKPFVSKVCINIGEYSLDDI
jgi:hypothetical protein